jgi:asparagine synthase (glutamine-hydrolysing)
MCGLAGVVHFDGSPVDTAVLQRMGAALCHRGPDAEGIHEDHAGPPSVGLVHRRLSIIDLSPAANQPLGGEDGRVLVMLNGEIYNFQDLRAPLEKSHTFRTHGDTEVIAHGYEDRGEEIIPLLDGMFAVAIWDARARRLVLARDPFGKKPLYYWSDSRRLVFGSEIKALLAAGVPAEMADEHLREYLAFGYVPTPSTFFKGIRKLPPAALMVVDARGPSVPRAYWDLTYPPEGEAARVSLEEATERVRALLEDAVRKRLVSDVPLGVLLSGGVDSSAVAAFMTRLVPGRVQTFAVGFEGDAYFDERPHAAHVARHLGTGTSRIRGGPARGRSPGDAARSPRRTLRRLFGPAHVPGRPRGAAPRDRGPQRGRRGRGVRGIRQVLGRAPGQPDSRRRCARSCARARASCRRAPTIMDGSRGCAASPTRARVPRWSASRAGARSSTCPRSMP